MATHKVFLVNLLINTTHRGTNSVALRFNLTFGRQTWKKIDFDRLLHVGASYISLALTFSKVRARSLRRSSFPNRTRFAGLRFGLGSNLERKSILPTYCTSEQAAYRLLRLFSKVRARSLRCSSFPNRTRFAGLRFGFGRSLERKSILPAYYMKNA